MSLIGTRSASGFKARQPWKRDLDACDPPPPKRQRNIGNGKRPHNENRPQNAAGIKISLPAGHAPREPGSVSRLGLLPLMRGDLILAKVGKSGWWPARVTEDIFESGTAKLFFFGDKKTGGWPMSALRPFVELENIPASQQPRSMLYQTALSEAQWWLANGAAEEEEEEEEDEEDAGEAVDAAPDEGEETTTVKAVARDGERATNKLGWRVPPALLNKPIDMMMIPFADTARRRM